MKPATRDGRRRGAHWPERNGNYRDLVVTSTTPLIGINAAKAGPSACQDGPNRRQEARTWTPPRHPAAACTGVPRRRATQRGSA
ncbi:hypothetical protein FRAAL5841 [Frankia alni ACN14a]|uniref:Uncharacterized protein n=1 Tax=Frankia alni (strain DSM 45986 / CECT 9034 / ACN14a) TaxID=326424 RepID=Q0RDJ6_FRAAA|nr:hypothetical protein FRAAL5841 [Frankia alni ACN14a]